MTKQDNNKQYWQALGVYTVLVCVYFYPIFFGQLIGQTDFLYFVAPWMELRPDDLITISNSILQDQSAEFLPFFLEAKAQISAGLFPLWNQYILAGTPLWANTQSALLFPLNFGHYLFSAPIGFTISSVLKIILSGFFTYIFARKIKLSHFAGLISGLVFSYAMFNIFWLNHPHTNATMLLPLSLYFAEKFLHDLSKRTVIQFALLVFFTLISGHVEITFIIAIATGIYLFIRALQLKILSLRLVGLFFSSYFIACLLAAFLLLPFLEFLIHSATWDARGENKLSEVPLGNILTLFLGKIFVSDAWSKGKILAHSHNLYVGIISLPLVIMAIRYAWKKSLVFVLLSIVSFLTFFNLASFHSLLLLIPIIKQTPLYYFVILWMIAASMLVGIGLDKCKELNWKIEPLTIISLLVVLIMSLAVINFQGRDFSQFIVDGLNFDNAKYIYLFRAITLILFALIIYAFMNKLKGFARVALLILFFSDMFLVGQEWNPTLKKEHAYVPSKDVISQFYSDTKEPFRVFSLHNILRPSSNMLINIEDVQGYDVPVSKRYHVFFTQILGGKDIYWRYNIMQYDSELLPYLRILNVTHILSKKKIKDENLTLQKSGKVKFYALDKPKQRAFMMYQTINADNPVDAVKRVIANKDQLDDVLILENNPSDEQRTKVIAKYSVEFYSRNSQKIKLKVTTSKAGWLVLSQSYYPGWQAYIDGEEVEIYPADYLLQAIKMPKGQHQIKFVYRPLSFYFGLLVSLLSFGFVLWQLKRRKK